ncbi:MAG: discoidin domain-containing protein [Phycisphaerales bacterium]|nr:MAG: discoidin domain-containing protein [Phycisphaerales bacterium]
MYRQLIHHFPVVLVLGLILTSTTSAELIGWWKLDETSGTIASDSSGNGNDGTLQGDVTWVPGKIGGAWQGDGSGDYIRVPHSELLMIQDAITISVWLNHQASPADQVICKSNGTGLGWQSNYAIRLDDQGPRRVNWRGRNNANQSLTSTALLAQDEWIHVACTFDIAEGVNKIYINGVLDSQNTSTLQLDPGSGDLFIGADQYPTNSARWTFQGMLDDIRIYDEALTQEQILVVMSGRGLDTGAASSPIPDNEAIDVPRESVLSWEPGPFANTHDVYLGANFDDVNNADASSLLLVGPGQNANTYDPGRLELGQTYFWRIDEVNAPPDSTVFKGEVWSFTTEPIGYPIDGANIAATASSAGQADLGPEKTIDGSGLDDNDLHSTAATNMWLSDNEPLGAWIQYELDTVHKLHEMWVWNSNQVLEAFFGFGIRDVTVEYSTNGVDWTALANVPEFARAPGTDDYAHDTIVDFGGAVAQYVRLTATSNWGGILPQYGLSEVRFFHIPVSAREPSPDSGAADVDVDATLSWRAGREAATHDVYLSADEQAVIDGTAPAATVADASYSPSPLDLGRTYYWRVDEVNETEMPTTWQGDVWNFSTPDYLVVDGFEDYNDYPPDEIYSTWLDGYENPANGSQVGYLTPPTIETGTVHGGAQSMPLLYSNTGGATYSEAERTFAVPQDWAKYGIQTLVLYFQGTVGNTGQVYVKVNGVKVPYPGAAADIQELRWKQWNIDLASLGVNLASVTTLAIGIDGNGAAGTLYIDDIVLYRLAPEIVVPSEEIWIEAEAADTITAPMLVYDDPIASGGKYISTDESVGNSSSNPPADGVATYNFAVAGGTYKVSIRVQTPDGSNSFWFRIQGATTPAETGLHSSGWVRWNDPPDLGGWFWSDVFSDDDSQDATVLFTMDPGTYTLEVARREDGAQLDVIVISKID